MSYTAPLRDIRFALNDIVGFEALSGLPAFADLSADLTEQVLGEAARLAADVIGPLNASGDREGARRHADGSVSTADGFARAYRQWVEAGWGSLPFDPDYGGQGLPRTLMLAVQEMVQGANPSFGLAPLLTQGAIEALSAHGTQDQKDLYLAKLISGEWTGTMNLTEPQAGSDVGALRTRAVRKDDGTYAITGSKIWITYGEHDMAENIIHLVLARLPDGPPGTRGISLFLVPKVLVNPDGSLGARNDVICTGIEHKLGIHASPTCSMSYGEQGGATGFLIGRENRGMACMFTMMNNARLNVGIQGVGVAQAAFEKALAHARERRQGKPFGLQHEPLDMIEIIQHPDVRRMLWTMKAKTEAIRAICYATAVAADMAVAHPDEETREAAKGREELLTPIAKAYSTDVGVEVASMGVQIHGGMGFIEETGAAQFYRDARIFPIYEGTNGIQANDLVVRKLSMQGGAVMERFMTEMTDTARRLQTASDARLEAIGAALKDGLASLRHATDHMGEALRTKPNDALAGAVAFQQLLGTVASGHFLGLGALCASARIAKGDMLNSYLETRIAIAQFHAATIMPGASGFAAAAMRGADILYTPDVETLMD